MTKNTVLSFKHFVDFFLYLPFLSSFLLPGPCRNTDRVGFGFRITHPYDGGLGALFATPSHGSDWRGITLNLKSNQCMHLPAPLHSKVTACFPYDKHKNDMQICYMVLSLFYEPYLDPTFSPSYSCCCCCSQIKVLM